MNRHWSILSTIAASLIIAGCGADGSNSAYDERSDFDEDAARAEAVSQLSSVTFEDVGDTLRCTDDCSGHNAGWQWAQENYVTESYECSGSGSFADGCDANSAISKALASCRRSGIYNIIITKNEPAILEFYSANQDGRGKAIGGYRLTPAEDRRHRKTGCRSVADH